MTNNLEQLERFRKEQEFTKDLKDTLMRLEQNEDYQKIKTFLFDTRVKQLMKELATVNADPLVNKIQLEMRAIALIQAQLTQIVIDGSQAEQYLALTDEEIYTALTGEAYE